MYKRVSATPAAGKPTTFNLPCGRVLPLFPEELFQDMQQARLLALQLSESARPTNVELTCNQAPNCSPLSRRPRDRTLSTSHCNPFPTCLPALFYPIAIPKTLGAPRKATRSHPPPCWACGILFVDGATGTGVAGFTTTHVAPKEVKIYDYSMTAGGRWLDVQGSWYTFGTTENV